VRSDQAAWDAKTTAWILTFGDMISLLVVFFVLFFSLSQPRPEEIDRKKTPAVGQKRIVYDVPVSRRTNFPGWWSPVGHVRFRHGATALDVDQLRHLETLLRKKLLTTGASIVLAGYKDGDCDSGCVIEDVGQQVAKIRRYLIRRGIDRRRIVGLATPCRRLFESLIERQPPEASDVRVQIYVAPVEIN